MKTCRIPGCDHSMFAREMCEAHYQRWYRNKAISIAAMLEPVRPKSKPGMPASLARAIARAGK